MEKRVFGCPEFSDVIFNISLTLMEKIFDFILQDHYTPVSEDDGSPLKTFKVGFYANNVTRSLNVMVEVFEKDEVYQERFTSFSPDYMKDPVDYYLMHNI